MGLGMDSMPKHMGKKGHTGIAVFRGWHLETWIPSNMDMRYWKYQHTWFPVAIISLLNMDMGHNSVC